MFALCHFKGTEDSFVLYDKNDLKEVAEHMNLEIEKELSFEEFDKDYSMYPMADVNDILLKAIYKKQRTNTTILDEIHISCWAALKKEYAKVQEKKSNLSRSQRELVEKQYTLINTL